MDCILPNQSVPLYIMNILKFMDSPITWAIVGMVIGIALGANGLSVILVCAGLGLFLLYLRMHGPAEEKTEGKLFSCGPLFMAAWIVGFMVHGLLFVP